MSCIGVTERGPPAFPALCHGVVAATEELDGECQRREMRPADSYHKLVYVTDNQSCKARVRSDSQ